MGHQSLYILKERGKHPFYRHGRGFEHYLLPGPLAARNAIREFQKIRSLDSAMPADEVVYMDLEQRRLLYHAYDSIIDSAPGYRRFQSLLARRWKGWRIRKAFRGVLDFRDEMEGHWPEFERDIQNERRYLKERRPFVPRQWHSDAEYAEFASHFPIGHLDLSDEQRSAYGRMVTEYSDTLWLTVRREGEDIHHYLAGLAWDESPLLSGPDGMFEDINRLARLPVELLRPSDKHTHQCLFINYDERRAFAWKAVPGWADYTDPAFARRLWPGWKFHFYGEGPRRHAELTGLDPDFVL